MEIIKTDTHFNFVRLMKPAVILSLAVILMGIASLIWHGGPNYGIDFAGGSDPDQVSSAPDADKIRSAFKTVGFEGSIIQQFGPNEVIVRTAEASTDPKGLTSRVDEALTAAFGKGAYEVRRIEMVGPKVGKDLTKKALLAIIFSWIGILIYVGVRFEFRYALGGIVALIHDVLVTITFLSLFDKEFDLNIVAALLTIIGYSINDTIVIFDRIRENARKNIKMSSDGRHQRQCEPDAQQDPPDVADGLHGPDCPVYFRRRRDPRFYLCTFGGYGGRRLFDRVYRQPDRASF